nr:hypothetical protein [Anaerolineae bacterium]
MSRIERSRRFRRVWISAAALVLILLAAGFAWLFRLRIERLFERAPTLPPPPPSAVSGSDSGIIYTAQFDEPDLTAWEEMFDDGIASAQVADGRLVVSLNAAFDAGTWLGLNYTFSDYLLEVDVTWLSGNPDSSAMILFRLVDADNVYRLDIGADGSYSVSTVLGGAFRVISDYNLSPAVRTGSQVNHVRITSINGKYEFAVNDEVLPLCITSSPGTRPIWSLDTGECLGGEIVMAWENTDLLEGKIGLGVQAYAGFDGTGVTPAVASVAYDDLVIRASD